MDAEEKHLEIGHGIRIPLAELVFATSRSGGPGGQNVNKVETRVTLLFDLEGSRAIPPEAKARVAAKLASRIGRDGCLSVTSQRHRSQAKNRDAAVGRFAELLREALHRDPPRKKTKPTKAARAKRLDGKRIDGQKKRDRKPVREE